MRNDLINFPFLSSKHNRELWYFPSDEADTYMYMHIIPSRTHHTVGNVRNEAIRIWIKCRNEKHPLLRVHSHTRRNWLYVSLTFLMRLNILCNFWIEHGQKFNNLWQIRDEKGEFLTRGHRADSANMHAFVDGIWKTDYDNFIFAK